MSARLLVAARVYAFNYLQDEAEEVESCTCGPKQHAEAKELFAAIKEAEAAPLPAEQPSNPVPHADTVDAERWRRWMPWMRRLQKLPFNLAKELHEIEQDEARILGQQTKGGGNV